MAETWLASLHPTLSNGSGLLTSPTRQQQLAASDAHMAATLVKQVRAAYPAQAPAYRPIRARFMDMLHANALLADSVADNLMQVFARLAADKPRRKRRELSIAHAESERGVT
jgi:hypothetical protein